MYHKKIDPILGTATIAHRVKDLALSISGDYLDKRVDEVVVVGVMKGSFMFFSDLVRELTLPKVWCEFVGVSSYEGTSSTGNVELRYDLNPEVIRNKHVLLVEDIYDTGKTLKFLIDHLNSYEPLSIQICCLLSKKTEAERDVQVDYVGFDIDKDAFVVGYGLDLDGLYRNVPYIGVPYDVDD